jgi:hypothetical protein
MSTSEPQLDNDPEFEAIRKVYSVLSGLDTTSQKRVLEYVAERLKIPGLFAAGTRNSSQIVDTHQEIPTATQEVGSEPSDDEGEGISPIAQKWMRRNGLTAASLSLIFSLGVDEIDLVAKKVPGRSQRDKTRSVALLKGVAAYLGSGVARFSHEQLKETCLHYDAYDAPNFAKYLKGMTAEISGSKESGYSLTSRGLAAATEVLKQLSS